MSLSDNHINTSMQRRHSPAPHAHNRGDPRRLRGPQVPSVTPGGSTAWLIVSQSVLTLFFAKLRFRSHMNHANLPSCTFHLDFSSNYDMDDRFQNNSLSELESAHTPFSWCLSHGWRCSDGGGWCGRSSLVLRKEPSIFMTSFS